jgi:predicted phage-related endonuclease
VWADKLGLIPPESFAESDMGHLFERPLLEHYSRKTGVALTYPETMIHPLHKWVSATPDGLASDRVVQVKVVGANMAHKWDAGVPEYVVCQVQWEMMVTGMPLAVVVACVGGTDYRALDVPADLEIQETLLDLGRTFWEGHVLTGAPPDPDASEACRKALSARHRKHSAELVPASRELIEMAREHKRLGKQASLKEEGRLEEERDAIGNALRLSHRRPLRVRVGRWAL